MLQALKLLLPALVPSWRFFDGIAPSPRIEFALLKTAEETPAIWHEFRPRPAKLSIYSMFKRLLWNPDWNEFLFATSCAERLLENPTEHSRQEILTRIKAELTRKPEDKNLEPFLQFRLSLVSRYGTELQKRVAFVSPIYTYSQNGNP